MICRNVKTKLPDLLPDLLLDPAAVPAELRSHLESCAECSRELREIEATMSLLDGWETPEVSPFFDARMAARLRAEQEAAPAGWLERMRTRLLFGNHLHLAPLAAAALALMVAVGGGMYAGFSAPQPTPVPVQSSSPVIRDLQSLDENAAVFQQLNSMDDQQSAGSSAPAPSGSL